MLREWLQTTECSKEQSNSGGGGNNVSLGLLRDGTKSGEKGIRKEKAFSWALKWQVEVNQLDQVNQEESWLHLQKKEHALKVLRHVVGSFWHCTCLREAAVWCMGLCWKADREQSLWGLVCVLIGVYLDPWDKRVAIRFTFDLPHTHPCQIMASSPIIMPCLVFIFSNDESDVSHRKSVL